MNLTEKMILNISQPTNADDLRALYREVKADMASGKFTVIAVDENGRSKLRLGRYVSKKQAFVIAAMWTRNGATGVQVRDSIGNIVVA